MNLTLERAPALSALARVVGVVERRHTIPILSNVALNADGEALQVRATDLDMEAVESIPAQIATPGQITLPADKLHDIVRNAEAGAQIALSLGSDDPRVKVKSGRSRFSLPALAADAFPTFTADGLESAVTLPAKTLADMLSRVAFAKGQPTPFTAMSCVYLVTQGEEIHAVACSHAGIAFRRETAPAGGAIAAVLPPKLVAHVSRWLADAEGDAVVAASGSLIRIQHGASQITSKVFDGAYFDYGRLLMEAHEVTARTDQDALSAAIRRVLVVADAKTLSVRLTFSEGQVTVATKNDESGEGSEELAADYEGPNASFMLVAGQLVEALGSLRGDVVELGFAPVVDDRVNQTKQVVIRAPCDAGFVANLMQPRA